MDNRTAMKIQRSLLLTILILGFTGLIQLIPVVSHALQSGMSVSSLIAPSLLFTVGIGFVCFLIISDKQLI